MKRAYDKRAKTSSIKVGDRVLLLRKQVKASDIKKFHLPWTGVYRVIEIQNPVAIIVSCSVPDAYPFKVHLNQLKKYISLEGPACTKPFLSEEDYKDLKDHAAELQPNIPGYGNILTSPDDGEDLPSTSSKPQHSYNLRPRHEKGIN